ncbi:MAG TPA: hypothetical protein VMV46_01950 [Thermoanaerobaculia bacterium]|nr:hypothetical protein [Thermoanaerobaculia bacterium]
MPHTRRSRPLLALVGASLLLAAAGQAQAPELAGTWRIDLAASDASRNGPSPRDTRLTVSLVGDDVRIAREIGLGAAQPRTHDATYVTDGKPHEVPGILQPTQQVRARWRKDKLQISYAISRQSPRGAFELDVTEVWSVDKEGALQIAYSTRVQDRNVVRREIYRRE